MKQKNLMVYYSRGVLQRDKVLTRVLSQLHNHVTVSSFQHKQLPDYAFDENKGQYNASLLLNDISYSDTFLRLWLIHEDIFVSGMNFVFGLAKNHDAAIVSNHRLPSIGLFQKEIIHELGHMLGLSHCSYHCVMQFSNSLLEARNKPSWFCEPCLSKLDKIR